MQNNTSPKAAFAATFFLSKFKADSKYVLAVKPKILLGSKLISFSKYLRLSS